MPLTRWQAGRDIDCMDQTDGIVGAAKPISGGTLSVVGVGRVRLDTRRS